MHNHGIKSIYYDNAWYPSQGKIGIGTLSAGNYLQIEAEYQLKQSNTGNFVVDNLSTDNESACVESYDVVTKHEVGTLHHEVGDVQFSNDYAWLCDSAVDSAGKALSFPSQLVNQAPTHCAVLHAEVLGDHIYSPHLDANGLDIVFRGALYIVVVCYCQQVGILVVLQGN